MLPVWEHTYNQGSTPLKTQSWRCSAPVPALRCRDGYSCVRSGECASPVDHMEQSRGIFSLSSPAPTGRWEYLCKNPFYYAVRGMWPEGTCHCNGLIPVRVWRPLITRGVWGGKGHPCPDPEEGCFLLQRLMGEKTIDLYFLCNALPFLKESVLPLLPSSWLFRSILGREDPHVHPAHTTVMPQSPRSNTISSREIPLQDQAQEGWVFFKCSSNLLVNNKGYKSSHFKVNVLLKNPTVKLSE